MSRQTGAQLGKMPELSTDRRFHNLSREQVQTLDQVLTEVIPIHGRGNFPTLEVKPKDIIHVVKDRLVRREVKVRDVRLNGSTASHVLVKENGTSYKDLDIIFGVELPRQEDFQIIKEVVLGCLLDFLPQGVNKDKITALTMKEAYVQKMVKVFNEHDRWSLISLSNNRGKNVELKFVSSLRRQFEFSVDSFQIILDSMLESYLEAEKSDQCQMRGDETPVARGSRQFAATEESPSTLLDLKEPSTKALDLQSQDERICQNKEMVLQEDKLPQPKEAVSETVQPEEPLKNKEPQKNSESLKGAGVELGIKAEVELRVLSLLETFRDILLPETHTQTEVSLETGTLSSSETPAHSELLTIPEAKDIVSEIPSPAVSPGMEEAKTPEAPFDHPVQLCTTLTEKTQNSLLEKLSPPPSKKTCKKSKMVVLKHSSPKPPRKMSKKVRNVRNTSPSPDKTSLVNEFPVHTNPCLTPESDPAKIIFEAHSNQSMPEEELNTLMDPPQSRTSTSLDKECQVHLECQDHIVLSEDGPPQACGTRAQAESTCSQSQHQEPEIPLEVGLSQKAEPDCGDIAQESVDQEPGLSAQPINSHNEVTPRSQEVDTPVTPRELPAITVVAESMYGDFEQAMDHLRYRLIATRNPEEIRGGGLLKYSNLLVRDFRPASETEIKTLERYMCSRFFIDFPDVNEQQRKIESYLRNHFIGEESSKYDYLMTLRRVINESTVCLMGHERRQTLNMITVLALKVLGEQNAIPNTTNVTCFYQPAPYMADHNFNNYYIAHNQPPLIYHPYPLHIHMQTSLV